MRKEFNLTILGVQGIMLTDDAAETAGCWRR